MPEDALADALTAAGGAAAPPQATARLRDLLTAALRHGRDELTRPRSGRDLPVTVAIAAGDGMLLAVTPVDAALRADPHAATERGWLLAAATVGALVELAEPGAPASADDLALQAGEHAGGFLALGYPAPALDEDLVPLAFEEQACRIDRLRSRALAVPSAVLADAAASLRDPIGAGHPLRIAEAVARLGGRPADPRSVQDLDDAVLALVEPAREVVRPHEDPEPARRVARRILQRLNGMGKWGGYHTDFAHLARGFGGNDRALAQAVGEALVDAGLLEEKPSVGQRHVFLNPRRAAEIYRLIDDGELPTGLHLPQE